MAGNSGGSYGGQQYGNSYMPSYNGYSMGGLQQMGQGYTPNYGGYSMGGYPQAFGGNMQMSRNMYQPNYGMGAQNPFMGMMQNWQPQNQYVDPGASAGMQAAAQGGPATGTQSYPRNSAADWRQASLLQTGGGGQYRPLNWGGDAAGLGPAAAGPGVNPELAALYGNRWGTDQR